MGEQLRQVIDAWHRGQLDGSPGFRSTHRERFVRYGLSLQGVQRGGGGTKGEKQLESMGPRIRGSIRTGYFTFDPHPHLTPHTQTHEGGNEPPDSGGKL